MVKLLGLSAGRSMGNSEILLKEALHGAEDAGAEVELLRLHDLTIKPCTGCASCVQGPRGLIRGGDGSCVLTDDDMPLFDEKLRQCDALVISTPVFVFQPPGYLKVLIDRCGPSHDHAFLRRAAEVAGRSEVDPRVLRPRVAGFIGVGGAPHHDWVSLGVPLLHGFTFPMQMQVVDTMQVVGAAIPGQVAVDDGAMARARALGTHVAVAGRDPAAEHPYHGAPGTCPCCHSDVLVPRGGTTVECGVCGIQGTLSVHEGDIVVDFPPEQRERSRLTLRGSEIHFEEIQEVQGRFDAARAEIKARMRPYRTYRPRWGGTAGTIGTAGTTTAADVPEPAPVG